MPSTPSTSRCASVSARRPQPSRPETPGPVRLLGALVAAAVATVLAPPAGQAEELRVNAAGVRIGPEGFDFIKALLPGLVPSSIAVPDLTKPLPYDCPAGRTIDLNLSQASADLKLNSFDAQLGNGGVDLSVNLDVAGRGHIDIVNAYSCYGMLSCDVTFALNRLGLSGKLDISADAGAVKVGLSSVELDLAPEDLVLDISNCNAEGLVEGLVDLAKSTLFDYAKIYLASMLEEKVAPVVQEKLQGLLGKEGKLLGFDYRLALGDVRVQPEGLDAYLSLGLTYEGPSPTCIPADQDPGPVPAVGQLNMASTPRAAFGLGVSTAIVSDLLRAVWRSGLLCFDDAKVAALGLDLSQFDLASAVPGLPAGTTLGFSATMKRPPTVMGGGGEDLGTVQLGLTGLEVSLQLAAPGAVPSNVVLEVDGLLGARPGVDDVTGTIGLELADLSITKLSITNGGDQATAFNLDPARLEQLVSDLLLPLLHEQVGRVPLAPAAFGVLGYYLTVDGLAVQPEGVYVGVGAFQKPLNDQLAPTTRIDLTPGTITRPGLVKFLLGGTDDQTPEKLLRYSWQLDDGAASEPTFAREIRVPVTTAGQHTFRVVAVDLNDNVDPNPQQFVFTLDPTPPVLNVVSAPEALITESTAQITVSGSDDLTPADQLLYSYKVEEALPGAPNLVITESQPQPLNGPIALQNLRQGGVYTVTVTVQDQAGNVTSQVVAFSVNAASGCSVGAAPASSGPAGAGLLFVLLAGAALFVRCSRRAGAR